MRKTNPDTILSIALGTLCYHFTGCINKSVFIERCYEGVLRGGGGSWSGDCLKEGDTNQHW